MQPFELTAANDRNPPFVLDIPRYAALSTNVVEGLTAAVRRVCHQWQQCAGCVPCKVGSLNAQAGLERPFADLRVDCAFCTAAY